MRKLAAGNWKMNGTRTSLAEVDRLIAACPEPGCDVLICPPATLIAPLVHKAEGALAVGGQDCHWLTSGAHTGDISAEMLSDAGATHVILGHSERRSDHGETDEVVRAKVQAAWAAGLVAIVCVGETEEERDAGGTLNVIGRQVEGSLPDGASAENTVIAYEPVWAIGTGRTPTATEIAEVHAFLRSRLAIRYGNAGNGMRLLYGGSVKASNCTSVFAIANVDGALVGGASLKAEDFAPIVEALSAAG
ncbi:triose-phosphate isomerase [Haematobacter missouriensis]|uniref:Triosephosphate isomerase n=1 Tax=Haematobacter missouriensis TaxID=366616 RepID=A0A212ATG9_9RHOB|nr:triose-phosphate isomerase [Haematobacter missouriensis]OWJ84754.1 triose-phosphate isomerase [Haematobacter missouriensis]